MNVIKVIWDYLTETDDENRDYVYTRRYGGFQLDIDKYYQKEENLQRLKEINNSELARSLTRQSKHKEGSEELA